MENLKIDESINRDLRKVAGWAKFLAILLYIGLGITILYTLVMVVMGIIAMTEPYGGGAGTVIVFSNLITGIITGLLQYFPASYAMRYSNRIKDALTLDNQQNMQEAFRALGSYFKFYGIINIILLCIIPVALIFFFLVGAAAYNYAI